MRLKAGPGRIDKYQIAHVEKAVVVVHYRIWCGRCVGIVRGDDALRPKGSHVQPDGRRARAAVIKESDRTRRTFIIGFEIRDVEHAGCRSLALISLLGILRDIVPILRVDDESASKRVIVDESSSNGDGALAGLLFGFEFLRLCGVGFVCGCVVFRLREDI
jgi:hypothetical protein